MILLYRNSALIYIYTGNRNAFWNVVLPKNCFTGIGVEHIPKDSDFRV